MVDKETTIIDKIKMITQNHNCCLSSKKNMNLKSNKWSTLLGVFKITCNYVKINIDFKLLYELKKIHKYFKLSKVSITVIF